MPQINLMQPSLPIASFSVDDSLITIAGVEIDAAARQQDSAVLIEVRGDSTGALEGGDGPYLAQIRIPARRYNDIELPADEEAEDAEGGMMSGPKTERVPVALDANAIEIILWPIG